VGPVRERFPAGQRIKGRLLILFPTARLLRSRRVWKTNPCFRAFVDEAHHAPSISSVLARKWKLVVLGREQEEQKFPWVFASSEQNPWDEIEKKFTIGSRVERQDSKHDRLWRVRGARGRHRRNDHVSDLSWTRKINHPSEVFKKGDEVEAVVIDIDKVNQRISLGIKQLTEDPWKTIDEKYKIGDLVKGKVTKLASFGAFVQLQDDIDGLVHISQLSEDHVAKVKDVLKVGQEVEARVIKVDKVERRIGIVDQGR